MNSFMLQKTSDMQTSRLQTDKKMKWGNLLYRQVWTGKKGNLKSFNKAFKSFSICSKMLDVFWYLRMHHSNWSLDEKRKLKRKIRIVIYFSLKIFLLLSCKNSKCAQHVQNSLICWNNLKDKHSENRRLFIAVCSFGRCCCSLSWKIISGVILWAAIIHSV